MPAGRPREPTAMRLNLHLRLTPDQRAAWEIAAGQSRRSISDWIRVTLDDAAALVIARLTRPVADPDPD